MQEDKLLLSKVDNSMRLVDVHYKMALPFRDENVYLPNNLRLAEQRLKYLKRKIEGDKEFASENKAFMRNLFEKGYAEKVPKSEIEGTEGRVCYIPHFGVYHPQKEKLRVVFYCAAKYEGPALNSQLLSGPNLTNTLLRENPVVLVADIECMFYAVRNSREDRNFMRFLWWPDGDVTKCIERVYFSLEQRARRLAQFQPCELQQRKTLIHTVQRRLILYLGGHT